MKKGWFLIPSLLLLILVSLWNIRPRPHQLKDLLFSAPSTSITGLQVQFLGNTNILLDDGETKILTDGFFTRPPAHKLLFGKVTPNSKRIQACLETAGISSLDAVIPVHSHFDHAMDAPIVASLTGGQLIGSPSTLKVGEGLGLSPDQMVVAPLDSAITIGKFSIRFIESHHWQYPDAKQRERLLDQPIKEAIIPPASIYDYKEGISYTILIEHGDYSMAIQGTAGFKAHSIPDFDADILFLAIAGLEVMDEAYNQNYQEHVVEAVNPEVIVPIHWDDFTVPLKRGLKTTNLPFNMKMGTDLESAFEILESNNVNRSIVILPLWDQVKVEHLIGIDE